MLLVFASACVTTFLSSCRTPLEVCCNTGREGSSIMNYICLIKIIREHDQWHKSRRLHSPLMRRLTHARLLHPPSRSGEAPSRVSKYQLVNHPLNAHSYCTDSLHRTGTMASWIRPRWISADAPFGVAFYTMCKETDFFSLREDLSRDMTAEHLSNNDAFICCGSLLVTRMKECMLATLGRFNLYILPIASSRI